MISILFANVRTYGHQIKCNYLRKKTFSEPFDPFLPSTSNDHLHFENKYDPHSLFISEIMEFERRV